MRLFGTDGIRGRINRSPMTPEQVLRIGMAAAQVLRNEHGRNMVIIGKDTRLSGYMIESALTSGICSMGMNVTLTGPIPTPGIAFLTRALRLDAGIVISASHNPFEDNGIKFFSGDGFKLPDALERKIEELVIDGSLGALRPSGVEVGRAFRLDDAVGRYIEYIKSTVPRGSTLEGLRVVVDAANGAAYKVTPLVLQELGAEVITINDEPDGMNINKQCGSLHMEHLRSTVVRHRAHAGIAHDGDADRTLLCDEKGTLIDGDRTIGIWAVRMKKEGRLRKDTVVATVMSNYGLEEYLRKNGITLLRTKVGDRYVAESLLSGGYSLGGEQSGHVICLDYQTTGDGPITALSILNIMKAEGKPLSKLAAPIKLFPQTLITVPVTKKIDIRSSPKIMAKIREAENRLAGHGRVLVRASGTEHAVRVMVEAYDRKDAEGLARSIAGVIKKTLSV